MQEAEDAVQTTFLNAFRAFRRGVRPELEAAWLYAIAGNVCRSRRRSFFRRRRVECDDDLDALSEVIAAPARFEAEALMGLGNALADLPESQRNAILLREWQGLSYAEIAKEMGISGAAVETLIFRARRNLAQGLEAEGGSSRRGVVSGLNVGSLLTGLKALLGAGGAAKLAAAGATVVVVTAAAVPAEHHSTPAAKSAAAPLRSVVSAPSTVARDPVALLAAPFTTVGTPRAAKKTAGGQATVAKLKPQTAVVAPAPAEVAATPVTPAPHPKASHWKSANAGGHSQSTSYTGASHGTPHSTVAHKTAQAHGGGHSQSSSHVQASHGSTHSAVAHRPAQGHAAPKSPAQPAKPAAKIQHATKAQHTEPAHTAAAAPTGHDAHAADSLSHASHEPDQQTTSHGHDSSGHR